MSLGRSAIALDPRRFGRRGAVLLANATTYSVGGDLRLFATTFAAGFVFVFLLIL